MLASISLTLLAPQAVPLPRKWGDGQTRDLPLSRLCGRGGQGVRGSKNSIIRLKSAPTHSTSCAVVLPAGRSRAAARRTAPRFRRAMPESCPRPAPCQRVFKLRHVARPDDRRRDRRVRRRPRDRQRRRGVALVAWRSRRTSRRSRDRGLRRSAPCTSGWSSKPPLIRLTAAVLAGQQAAAQRAVGDHAELLGVLPAAEFRLPPAA